MPGERTSTIENAIDLARLDGARGADLRAELGVPAERALGLLVATIRRDKGIEVLLDAVAAATQRERMHIAVAGVPLEPDYVARCQRQLARLGLAGTVTFLGGRTDVPALLRSVDFALLSSHTESGPLVLIEYMAAMLPFVATQVGDIGRRVAAAGIPGFVPPGQPAAFAAALDQLLALAPAERRARGLLGRQLLTREFDIRVVMPRWYAAYQSALARAARASA
jgi:glycosyltransferase involved in cell wall biosynthesis